MDAARWYGAMFGLAVGLFMALAANLTYAVPRGPVIVGLGLAAPIVLPLVLWIRSTFTTVGFWPTLFRELAMLMVAGPAVAISYSHTYHLVLEHGEPWIIALVAPLSSDGVAGMSTMALHWARRNKLEEAAAKLEELATKQRTNTPKQRAPRTVTTTPSQEPVTNVEKPVAPVVTDDLGPRRASADDRVAWFLRWSDENPGASEAEENAAFREKFKTISGPTIRRTKAKARELVAS